jgi:hypothetical protein
MKTFTDPYGYVRQEISKNLLHRVKARTHIWAPNRDKYPLEFEEYDVHHKDENKLNNEPKNLEVLTREEHEKRHGFKIGGKRRLPPYFQQF